MRSQFAFYKSFDDVYQDLNDKQRLEFMKVLLDVQFLRVKIEDVAFKDNILKHIWNAQKHSIQKSIHGYLESQKSDRVKTPFLGVYDPFNTPSEGVHQEEKEKEEEKEQVKGKGKVKHIYDEKILSLPDDELTEKMFTLSKPMYFKDLPGEYLDSLERFLKNKIQKSNEKIANAGANHQVLDYDEFYLGAFNYTNKKYINYAMTYNQWNRSHIKKVTQC